MLVNCCCRESYRGRRQMVTARVLWPWLVALLSWQWVSGASAEAVISLSAEQPRYPLSQLFHYYDGNAPRQSWNALLDGQPDTFHWVPIQSRNIWGIEDSAVLLRARFSTGDVLPAQTDFVLDVPFLGIARVVIFSETGQRQAFSLGTRAADFHDFVGQRHLFKAPLALEPNTGYTLYLLSDNLGFSSGAIAYGGYLWDKNHYEKRYRPARNGVIGVCLGVVGLMLLFSLRALMVTPNIRLVAAVMYMIGIFGSLLLREDILFDWVLPQSNWWLSDGIFWFVMLRTAGVILFVGIMLGVTGSRWGRGLVAIGVGANLIAGLIISFGMDQLQGFIGVSMTLTIINFIVFVVAALAKLASARWEHRVFGLLWCVYFVVEILRMFYPILPSSDHDPRILSDIVLIISAIWVYQSIAINTVVENEELIRQQAINDARMDFVTHINHEIRTPLNAVIGLTDVLKQSDFDERQLRNLNVISTAGNTLLELIDNILDFAKIESGEFAFKERHFRLDRAVLDVFTTFSYQFFERGLWTHTVLSPNVPICVIGDELRLQQVLLNVIGNAYKFTEKGHVIISIRVDRTVDENTVFLRFAVEDTGPGIPDDKLDAMFDAFTQVDSDGKPQASGTGLGLTISKKLVEMNGGTIGVASQLGRGTTVYFTWQTKIAVGAERLLRHSWRPLQGKTVLLVIGADAIADLITPHMERAGMRLLRVKTLREGIARAAMQPFDAALIDASIDSHLLYLDVDDFLVQEVPTILAVLETPTRQFDKYPHTQLIYVPIAIGDLLDKFVVAVQHSENPNAVLPEPPSPVRGEGLPRLTVLVVDDNPTNLMVAKRLLESMGQSAIPASSGAEALTQTKNQFFDVIFMDLEMPDMDGFEAARRLRAATDSATPAGVPIIAFTAHSMGDIGDVCEKADMQGVLHKPVTLNRLRETLMAVIAQRRAQDTSGAD